MTRRCWLHIGMHKTGTTAIQFALNNFDDGKTRYLQLLDPNHSAELFTAFSHKRGSMLIPDHKKLRGRNITEVAEYIRRHLLSQITADRKDLVISGEALSRDLDRSEIESFRAFLAQHFDRISVIVYVREPHSYMRALAQENVKHLRAEFRPEKNWPNYRLRLSPWKEIFASDFVAHVYDPPAFPNGSVVADFANRIGVDLGPRLLTRANIGLSAEAFALRFAANSRLLAMGDKVPFRAKLAAMTEFMVINDFGGTAFDLDPEQTRAAILGQADDIDWIESVLGTPLPPARPIRGAKVFETELDIISYAEDVRPKFDQWKKRRLSPLIRLKALRRTLRGRKLT